MRPLAQRCYLANVYASYGLLLALALFFLWRSGVAFAMFVTLVGVVALVVYVRAFPSLSRFLGYGSVADTEAPSVASAATAVRLYTATGCPFCPIVRRRLQALQTRMGFTLEEVDVTLRPGVLLSRGIRAVPVVEAGDRVHVGHATTAELAALIAG